MATYLAAVNRILRTEGIIRGDDDAITSFSSSQHAASIEFAKIAVDSELAWLTETLKIPYEQTLNVILLVANQRNYELFSNFIRMTDERRMYRQLIDNTVFEEYLDEVEEDWLRKHDANYQNVSGTPIFYYFTPGLTDLTVTNVGLYPVPDASVAGRFYRYFYDKSVGVSSASDTIPLVTTDQFNAFVQVAARRFKFIRLPAAERNGLFPNGIDRDPILESYRATLISLMRLSKGPRKYGRRYG